MIHREIIDPIGDLDYPFTVKAGAFTTTVEDGKNSIICISPDKTKQLIAALSRCLTAQEAAKRKVGAK